MSRDLLIELGTEELPPKSLLRLRDEFAEAVLQGLRDAAIDFGGHVRFAGPRRLAIRVEGVAVRQQDQQTEKRGPALQAAFDAEGKPSRAATGFAASCGVAVEDLGRLETNKGSWLMFRQVTPGRATVDCIGPILDEAVGRMHVERGMRWGLLKAEFVRPLQWLLLMFGDEFVENHELFGVRSGRCSFGHRFMSGGAVSIARPADYEQALERHHVVANFEQRRQRIREQLAAAAEGIGARLDLDEALLDEVTALVEWPVTLAGRFDEAFLDVPDEALISAMKGHQRYFHLLDEAGRLLPSFLFVSNIESPDPAVVIGGNERVIRPRLADADFFYRQDRTSTLAEKEARLADILFQQNLGSYRAKLDRMEGLARQLAVQVGVDADAAARAARLCKCDLVTEMVGEFPELQGLMGYYYAGSDGETAEVARAIRDHLRPAFAGDALPEDVLGCVVAISDRLDTVCGLFGVSEPPSGSRDPFGLRRAALGVVRIVLEKNLDLDAADLVALTIGQFRVVDGGRELQAGTEQSVIDYLLERMLQWHVDGGGAADLFHAVRAANQSATLLNDTRARLEALAGFRNLEAAAALIAANKRIGNLLSKVENLPTDVEPSLFEVAAESALFAQLQNIEATVMTHIKGREYGAALTLLAGLREPVDAFFDDVMVMADDLSLRNNRLALLARIHGLFLTIADLSRLEVES